MIDFNKPKKVTGLDMAFGGNMDELLPKMSDIPQEFKNGRTGWNRLVGTWFFKGLKSFDCVPKEGVDKEEALQHVAAILGSFDPKHEHKEAGCAYLLSLWFIEPKYQSK